ncbi:MAG: ATP synthase F0 subunit B [Planctomycetes bacterium]|nr:ATP synthase F0 subunit B [Planctomycetota bacterium]
MMILAIGEGFNWGTFVVQFLSFAVLLFILGKFAFPPLKKMALGRSHAIEEQFARLDRELAEAEGRMSEYQRRLEQIGTEVAQRMQAGQEEAAKTRGTLLAEAQALAKAELEKAHREVRMERDKAVLELRATVTDLAVTATERAIDALMNESLHQRMVERTIAELDKAVRPT